MFSNTLKALNEIRAYWWRLYLPVFLEPGFCKAELSNFSPAKRVEVRVVLLPVHARCPNRPLLPRFRRLGPKSPQNHIVLFPSFLRLLFPPACPGTGHAVSDHAFFCSIRCFIWEPRLEINGSLYGNACFISSSLPSAVSQCFLLFLISDNKALFTWYFLCEGCFMQ